MTITEPATFDPENALPHETRVELTGHLRAVVQIVDTHLDTLMAARRSELAAQDLIPDHLNEDVAGQVMDGGAFGALSDLLYSFGRQVSSDGEPDIEAASAEIREKLIAARVILDQQDAQPNETPAWLDIDALVPPELADRAREMAERVRAEFAASVLPEAKALCDQIDKMILDATDRDARIDAMWDRTGHTALWQALRDAANATDPEGDR